MMSQLLKKKIMFSLCLALVRDMFINSYINA